MLTKPFKPLALAFLVNLIISVEDKIKYKRRPKYKLKGLGMLNLYQTISYDFNFDVSLRYKVTVSFVSFLWKSLLLNYVYVFTNYKLP